MRSNLKIHVGLSGIRKSLRCSSVHILEIVVDDMSSVFAHLGLCSLLLLTIQGSVQGFPTEDSSGSNEVDLAQNNANETDDAVSWSNWSDCSVACGGGKRTRIKLVPECNISTPAADDSEEPAVNSTDCVDTESCNVHQCPVDGKWSAWKPWSDCSATCGPTGVRTRQRKCEPAERHGGNDCIGDKQESGSCNRHVKCPVDGKWESWNPWSVCSATCGPTGVRSRHRECKPPLAERYGGNDCDGSNHQTEGCNRQHCPVHGGWAQWSDWSESSATCGSFQVFRTRTCTNPEPKYNGHSCSGSPREREWRTHRVAHCPIHGRWSSWSSWSSYSVTCGKPVVERTRSCTNPRPQYNGQNCNGKSKQTKVVDTRIPCPIHGGWSGWQARTKCPPSKMLWQFRSCTSPKPMHNGRLCNGTSQRRVPCEPILVDGEWCPWGAWNRCSKICYTNREDEQFRTRHRKCECPRPENGGQVCGPPITDTAICAVEDIQPCNPPTRAPCKKTTTPDYGGGFNYGDDYGNDYGGNAGSQEGTTAGPQFGNYGDYDYDC